MKYEFGDIVLGSSLEAVTFAFSNRYPIFFEDQQRPFRFDYFGSSVDLSFLKLPDTFQKTLTTFEGDVKIGIAKELLWERLLFLMSMYGSVPTANLCTHRS